MAPAAHDWVAGATSYAPRCFSTSRRGRTALSRRCGASRTLAGPLPWENSSLLKGNAADAVAALKRDVEGDLVVLGSGELVRSLAKAGLVDVYTLSIHPLTLGTGTKLFAEGEDTYATMRLVL
ncbi:dihydrofolate reductase family protein [Micromonospora sp. GCM10011542]|uniref:dihydrofolate reductase family protein n=1 Tax=Micromonospora sp. GCM10011542 TaxID=3317337 RepID=UPI00360F7D34